MSISKTKSTRSSNTLFFVVNSTMSLLYFQWKPGYTGKDPPRKGQPLYKGHFQHPQKCICNTFSTSEIRTTSLQGTKWPVPKYFFPICSSQRWLTGCYILLLLLKVRRDNCPLVSNLIGTCLKTILIERYCTQ